jgi:DNA transformation protein and related proteins
MSMRVTDGFRAFVLEQLADVKSLHARAMFGGIGLYADGVFFGIVAADTLYLKVDDSNRGSYEAAGMTAFKPYSDRPMSMSYYQVPVDVLEDRDELAVWARASVRVAARATPRKARRSSPRASSR